MAHMASLEHRDRWTKGLEIYWYQGSPMPFHHPTLPSGGTKGNQYKGKWVSRVTVWERWVRRKETEHTERNGLLAIQVQSSFFSRCLHNFKLFKNKEGLGAVLSCHSYRLHLAAFPCPPPSPQLRTIISAGYWLCPPRLGPGPSPKVATCCVILALRRP